MTKPNYFSENRPYPGEPRSGDLTFFKEIHSQFFLGICDVTGHGYKAHQLANTINIFLDHCSSVDTRTIMSQLNESLVSTIGAASSFTIIDKETGKGEFSGIGNVGSFLFGSKETCFPLTDGVLGHFKRSFKSYPFKMQKGDKLVFCSDGISSRFYSTVNRNIMSASNDIIVKTIMRDFSKSHDDASCLVFEY